MTRPKPFVLCILDGWGYRAETADNALALARLPNWQRWMTSAPHALLETSGRAVGLPDGQMGNSEVGHMNIGAGRILVQDLPRIDAAIADGSFAANPVLADLIRALKASKGTCHLLGLLSPGGVHSHQSHIAAVARLLDQAEIPVRIHAFLDGRDTPPQSASGFMEEFLAETKDLARTTIATVGGRYYAMDRDKRWDRVEKAYQATVDGRGPTAENPRAAISASYAAKVTDEFMLPTVIAGYDGMHDGDAVMMVNFRTDRAREILAALLEPGFNGFARPRVVRFTMAAGMVEYSEALKPFMKAFFPPQSAVNTLGEVISHTGLTQLRIAETEKYAHVTFFLNGGSEQEFPGESRIMVPSPKVATYDLQPEMSAVTVTDRIVEAIAKQAVDVIIVNFANGDMVGHTGILPAAIKAAETVDACLGRLEAALNKVGGAMLVTADHGNLEMMRDPQTHQPHTQHTVGPVAVVLVNGLAEFQTIESGRLADVAPTVLALLGLPQPAEMTGHSLLHRAAGASGKRLSPVAALFAFFSITGIAASASAQTAGPSAGQSPERLKTIEKTLKQSAQERTRLDRQSMQVNDELDAARRALVDLAKQIQDQEYSILLLENRIDELQHEVDQRGGALGQRDRQMRVALMALERLAVHPADALTLSPLVPDDAVRAAILLRAAVPAITSSTQVLQSQLADLYRLRAAITAQREDVASDAAGLVAKRATLEKLIAAKAAQQAAVVGRSHDLEERMTALAHEAEDLKGLFARLAEEKARRDAEERATAAANPLPTPSAPSVASPVRPGTTRPGDDTPLRLFSAARGTLPFPVVGRVRARYGEAGTDGQLSKGIVIATAPAATVVAPYDGVVAFAGPFRGYGQLLIIEHSEGYHSLMAGLGRIDTTVGTRVLAGEPVGVMAEDGAPSLYVELRRDGQPINPLPWLADRKPQANRDGDGAGSGANKTGPTKMDGGGAG